MTTPTPMRILVNNYNHKLLTYVGRPAYQDYLGLLTSPASANHPHHAIHNGAWWAMDNGAFTNFDAPAFIRALKRYRKITRCLFVVAPDVWQDAAQTCDLFEEWHWVIRYCGYPVAFVLQDGMSQHEMRWDDFDALFVGGSDEYKLSDEARRYVQEAKQRGKWVHMGRVNTPKRLQQAKEFGCDSVDGTTYVIEWRNVVRHLPILRDSTTYDQLQLF